MSNRFIKITGSLLLAMNLFPCLQAQELVNSYKIVDTGVKEFYGNSGTISSPAEAQPFYGQDAHYNGNQPSYKDNGDGTVSDLVTGLMWQQDMGEKISFNNAFIKADTLNLGGYADWRVPSLKELYSLINFTGITGQDTASSKLYIDTDYFIQPYGDTESGERYIDAQTWSSNEYVGKIMNGNVGIFGVNFIDGRIKGYPKIKPATQSDNKMYFRMVRGNSDYGKNNFVDNGDGTINDLATGLMWQQSDDGVARDWEESLAYAENLELAGHSDWRLPNAKELQSLVDYTRCPDVTSSPAIDSLFYTTAITDPDGVAGQYPYFWTGTTHLDGRVLGSYAVYIAFGEAQGVMNNTLMDVHGAGAQRGDPKTGNPADYPQFFGPQGDVRYVFNYVRAVRDLSPETAVKDVPSVGEIRVSIYPNPVSDCCSLLIGSDYEEIRDIAVYSMSGTRILSVLPGRILSGELVFDLNDLEKGTYLFRIQTGNEIIRKKFVKI